MPPFGAAPEIAQPLHVGGWLAALAGEVIPDRRPEKITQVADIPDQATRCCNEPPLLDDLDRMDWPTMAGQNGPLGQDPEDDRPDLLEVFDPEGLAVEGERVSVEVDDDFRGRLPLQIIPDV